MSLLLFLVSCVYQSFPSSCQKTSADQNVMTKVGARSRLLGVNRHNRYVALLCVNDVTLPFVSLLSLRDAPREPDGEEEDDL